MRNGKRDKERRGQEREENREGEKVQVRCKNKRKREEW